MLTDMVGVYGNGRVCLSDGVCHKLEPGKNYIVSSRVWRTQSGGIIQVTKSENVNNSSYVDNRHTGKMPEWSDKVCQWLVTGWWFSPGTPVSSTNKTDRYDITEILLKVALNTIKHTNKTNIVCIY